LFFKIFPNRPSLSLPVPGIFSRVHRHVVRRQFPPCSFDGKGKWDALPCLPAGSSRPRRVLVQGFLYFILFYFFRGGHARRERAAAAVGVIDGRTADFSSFCFPTTKKSNNFFSFCFYDDCWDNILCRTHKSGRDSISLL
jgi:hypothetical protein